MRKGLALLSFALLLSACGSGNGGSQGEGDSKTLRVGMECNYAPFNWTETESSELNLEVSAGGYFDGYDVKIAKQSAAETGRELVITKMDWDSLEPSLNSGAIDAIIAGMTDTEDRRQNADFTTPYYQSKMAMIENQCR